MSRYDWIPALLTSAIVAAAVIFTNSLSSGTEHRAQADTGRAAAQTPGTPGADGVGDSFFPKMGNGGYDVSDYHIDLEIDPSDNTITAVTTITATATQDLSAFNLDFSGLTISALTVDGNDATYSRSGTELTVTPRAPWLMRANSR